MSDQEEQDTAAETGAETPGKAASTSSNATGRVPTRKPLGPVDELVSDEAGFPPVKVAPHDAGLFRAQFEPEDGVDSWEPPVEFGAGGRNKIALVTIAIVTVAILGHLAMISFDTKRAEEVQAFLDGSILDYKTAEVLRLKKQWRDEDAKARNIYGDVTLTYFPADSQVQVTQVTYLQTGADWRSQTGNRKEVGRKEMPNDTAKLTEGQTIERLPLLNLGIFEAEKGEDGAVSQVFEYEYELEFSREGYYPQKKTWRKDSWQRVGPGNRIIDWQGLDLVPKPETIKDNFAKAMSEIHCLMKIHELPTLQAAAGHENFDMLLVRNRIKTPEMFDEYRQVLTGGEHAEWWKAQQETIAKLECEGAPAAKK